MGSWNETCMLTHLPILEGEPCVGFLVNATGVLGRTSYADKRYRPMSPPLFGLYDSYGRLEGVQEHERLFEVLLSTGTNVSIENEEEAVSSFSTLLSLVSEGKVRYKCGWQPANEVSLILIKRHFYEFALKYADATVHCAQELQQRLFPQPFDRVTSFMRHDDFELKDNWKLLLSQNALPHPLITRFAECGFDVSGIAAVNDFLEATRMHWTTTSGAGSQEYINPVMVKFLEDTLATAKEQLKEMDEES